MGGCNTKKVYNGWTPVLRIVEGITGSVVQVVNWVGGSGTKPKVGVYVGVDTLVDNISDAAVLITTTGPQGAQGAPGSGGTGSQGPQGAQGAQGPTGIGLQGAQGPQGQLGEPGPQGSIPEFRYAINGSTTSPPALNNTDREPLGYNLTYPNVNVGSYLWEIVAFIDDNNNLIGTWSNPRRVTGSNGAQGSQGGNGSQGPQGGEGAQGPQGNDGSEGLQGPQGEDGTPRYTWLKYADTPTTGMSDSPTGKDYIGLSYNQESIIESNNYEDYEWSLIKGAPGDTGVQGPQGDNGLPTYTWIKYGDDDQGAGISDSPVGKDYIGIAYNKSTQTESNTPSDYQWSLIKGKEGPQGNQGNQGSQGSQGSQGVQGNQGEAITGPAISYRGDWSNTAIYKGNNLLVEFVKYQGIGYLTRTDVVDGEVPVGIPPTDANYWNEVTANPDALFTDFLIAYSAYIANLVVGQLTTGLEPEEVPDPTFSSERATIGFQPTSASDPTTVLSRHGIRLYFPSGRIMMYQGWVEEFPIGDDEYITNKGVIIWFKDLENSPIDYYISDAQFTTPSPTVVINWYPIDNVVRFINYDEVDLRDELLDSQDHPRGAKMCYYWNGAANPRHGRLGIKGAHQIWRKDTTTGGVTTSKYVTAVNGDTAVPDGAYFGILGSTPNRVMQAASDEECRVRFLMHLSRMVDGVVLESQQKAVDSVIVPNSTQNQSQDCSINMPYAPLTDI